MSSSVGDSEAFVPTELGGQATRPSCQSGSPGLHGGARWLPNVTEALGLRPAFPQPQSQGVLSSPARQPLP